MVGIQEPKQCQQASESLPLCPVFLCVFSILNLPKALEAEGLPSAQLKSSQCQDQWKSNPLTHPQQYLEQKFWLFSYWPKSGHISKAEPVIPSRKLDMFTELGHMPSVEARWPHHYQSHADWTTEAWCSPRRRWSYHFQKTEGEMFAGWQKES